MKLIDVELIDKNCSSDNGRVTNSKKLVARFI
jgi:hypothetical protein